MIKKTIIKTILLATILFNHGALANKDVKLISTCYRDPSVEIYDYPTEIYKNNVDKFITILHENISSIVIFKNNKWLHRGEAYRWDGYKWIYKGKDYDLKLDVINNSASYKYKNPIDILLVKTTYDDKSLLILKLDSSNNGAFTIKEISGSKAYISRYKCIGEK